MCSMWNMDSEKTKKEYDEVRRYGHQALILCYRHAELPCDCHLPQLIQRFSCQWQRWYGCLPTSRGKRQRMRQMPRRSGRWQDNRKCVRWLTKRKINKRCWRYTGWDCRWLSSVLCRWTNCVACSTSLVLRWKPSSRSGRNTTAHGWTGRNRAWYVVWGGQGTMKSKQMCRTLSAESKIGRNSRLHVIPILDRLANIYNT